MFFKLNAGNHRYSSSLLCFIIVCILIVCISNERAEFEKLSYAYSNNVSSMTSSGNAFYDVLTDRITIYSFIKSVASKRPAAGKPDGSRERMICAVIGNPFILTGICVLFLLHFYRKFTTSHHFIITYIHNLDGMNH